MFPLTLLQFAEVVVHGAEQKLVCCLLCKPYLSVHRCLWFPFCISVGLGNSLPFLHIAIGLTLSLQLTIRYVTCVLMKPLMKLSSLTSTPGERVWNGSPWEPSLVTLLFCFNYLFFCFPILVYVGQQWHPFGLLSWSEVLSKHHHVFTQGGGLCWRPPAPRFLM